jgi:hypothetical protein
MDVLNVSLSLSRYQKPAMAALFARLSLALARSFKSVCVGGVDATTTYCYCLLVVMMMATCVGRKRGAEKTESKRAAAAPSGARAQKTPARLKL